MGIIHGKNSLCLIDILNNFPTKDDVIEFGLYCLRDVESFTKSDLFTKYNDLIEKWIDEKDPESTKCIASKFYVENWKYYSNHALVLVCQTIISEYIDGGFVDYSAWGKAWYKHYFNGDKRRKSYNGYFSQYKRVARNWLNRWKNPSINLLAISESLEFDQIFFDLLQDEREARDTIIPYNGEKYYLNLLEMKKEFTGSNQDVVMEKIKRSWKKRTIMKIIRRAILNEQNNSCRQKL